ASGRLQVPGVVTSDFATNYNLLQGRWCEYETTRSGLSQSLATMKFVYADVDRGGSSFPVNRNSLPILLVNGSGRYRPMSIRYTGSSGIYRCVWYVSDVLTATSLT